MDTKGKLAIIGHVDHNSTLMAQMAKEILMRQPEGTIIIDDGKPVSGHLKEQDRAIQLNHAISKLEAADLPVGYDYPLKKKHKPNKGLTLGTYKYRSR